MPPVLFLPDAPEPADYWMEADPRAQAAHKGILLQIVVDPLANSPDSISCSVKIALHSAGDLSP